MNPNILNFWFRIASGIKGMVLPYGCLSSFPLDGPYHTAAVTLLARKFTGLEARKLGSQGCYETSVYPSGKIWIINTRPTDVLLGLNHLMLLGLKQVILSDTWFREMLISFRTPFPYCILRWNYINI